MIETKRKNKKQKPKYKDKKNLIPAAERGFKARIYIKHEKNIVDWSIIYKALEKHCGLIYNIQSVGKTLWIEAITITILNK